MMTIRLPATITDDRKLIVTLPDDFPAGEVEVVITSTEHAETTNPEREAVRAALAAAGLLSNTDYLPDDFGENDDDTPINLPAGARGSEELINEDREER